MGAAESILAVLWAGGLAATPVALVVGAVCRWSKPRPATRHALWLAVLASFVTPAIGRLIWAPEWSRSERIIAAADSLFEKIERGPGPVFGPEPRSDLHAGDLDAPVLTAPSRAHDAEPPARVAMRPNGFQAVPEARPIERSHPRTAGRSMAAPPPDTRAREHAEREAIAAPAGLTIAIPQDPSGAGFDTGADSAPSTFRAEKRAAAAVPAPGSGPQEAAPAGPRFGDVRAWIAALLALRDAAAELPPVPGAVWLLGVAVILTTQSVRTLRAARLIRGARPAGAATCALVREVAADLGLRREPRVVVVDSAVSPMIWCGPRPRLVLPLSLWRTLDAASRRAVVVHELAHLKRKDHVLCWVEALIGAVYWWHPVAWWARRRLRDEAEACCDAWVTSLLPRSRRAYATALVAAKAFVSGEKGQGPSGAGPWLGVMSGSARKLARRIAMVMTQKTAPKVSVLGACVAVLVVAAGTFVSPTIACPPEEGQKKRASAPAAVVVKRGDKNKEKAPRAEGPGVRFYGEAPALDAMRPGQDPVVVTAPSPPAAPKAPRSPKPPKAPKVPRAGTPGPTPAPSAGLYYGVPSAPQPPAVVDLEALKVGRTARVYHLSEGKRDAFWELMSRNDVPVLVEARDDGIAVWARDDEHPVIEKFVRMIDPGTKQPGTPRAARRGSPFAMSVPAETLRQLELKAAEEGRAGQYLDALRSYQERAVATEELARVRARHGQELAERERAAELRAAAAARGGAAVAQRAAELAALSKLIGERAASAGPHADSLHELLARLEERTSELADRIAELDDDLEDVEFDEDVEDVEFDDDAEDDADEEDDDRVSFLGAVSPNPFATVPAALSFTAAPGEPCASECSSNAFSCDTDCASACEGRATSPCPDHAR